MNAKNVLHFVIFFSFSICATSVLVRFFSQPVRFFNYCYKICEEFAVFWRSLHFKFVVHTPLKLLLLLSNFITKCRLTISLFGVACNFK